MDYHIHCRPSYAVNVLKVPTVYGNWCKVVEMNKPNAKRYWGLWGEATYVCFYMCYATFSILSVLCHICCQVTKRTNSASFGIGGLSYNITRKDSAVIRTHKIVHFALFNSSVGLTA